MSKSIHVVNCLQWHDPSEDGWVVIGADSVFTAAVKALDFYWPRWTSVEVKVFGEDYEERQFRCTRNEAGDTEFEVMG